MLVEIWRWISSSRSRQIVMLSLFVLSAVSVAWGWQDFCLWRANAALVLRNDLSAQAWFKRSLWGRSLNAHGCLIKLRIDRRQKRLHDVELDLQRAVELGVSESEIKRQQWLASAQAGQFAEMQDHWTDLLADPRDDEPEIARSFVAWASLCHLLDDALQVINVWHQDFPLDPEPLGYRGQISLASHNYEAAEEAYRHAFTLSPDNDEYRLGLADVLGKRLKFGEAMSLYRQHLGRHSDDVQAISGLSQCYINHGEIGPALDLLRDVVQRHPDNLELRQSYGEALLSFGDSGAAAQELQIAYRAHPENADLAYSLGRALKGSGRTSDAEPLFAFVAESREPLDQLKQLEEQLRKQPKNIDLRTKIASITAQYKSREDAIRWYRNLLTVEPNHAPSHRALAELYRQTGDSDRSDWHAARGGVKYSY